MNVRRALLHLIAIAGMSIPGVAAADSITLDYPATFPFFPAGPSIANPVQVDGALPAFDGSLGLLDSVSIRVGGTGSAQLTLDVPEAGTYSGPLYVMTSFLDSVGGVLGASAPQTVGTIRGTSTGAGPLLVQDGNSWINTLDLTSGLGLFSSANDYSVLVTFFGTISGPGMASQAYVADAYSGVGALQSVTFSYTPVPEPSTALLVGIGLVGMAIRRIRASS